MLYYCMEALKKHLPFPLPFCHSPRSTNSVKSKFLTMQKNASLPNQIMSSHGQPPSPFHANTNTQSSEFPHSFFSFLKQNNIDPEIYKLSKDIPRYIRIKNECDEENVVTSLTNELSLAPTKIPWLTKFYCLPSNINISNSEAYKNGMIFGMDIASGAAIAALKISHGENVLDLCAAPGAKLCMIADILNNSGTLTAIDISKSRLSTCLNLLKKYKLNKRCRLYLADGQIFSILPPSQSPSHPIISSSPPPLPSPSPFPSPSPLFPIPVSTSSEMSFSSTSSLTSFSSHSSSSSSSSSSFSLSSSSSSNSQSDPSVFPSSSSSSSPFPCLPPPATFSHTLSSSSSLLSSINSTPINKTKRTRKERQREKRSKQFCVNDESEMQKCNAKLFFVGGEAYQWWNLSSSNGSSFNTWKDDVSREDVSEGNALAKEILNHGVFGKNESSEKVTLKSEKSFSDTVKSDFLKKENSEIDTLKSDFLKKEVEKDAVNSDFLKEESLKNDTLNSEKSSKVTLLKSGFLKKEVVEKDDVNSDFLKEESLKNDTLNSEKSSKVTLLKSDFLKKEVVESTSSTDGVNALMTVNTNLLHNHSVNIGYDKVLVDAECTHDGSIKHIEKFQEVGWKFLEQKFLDEKRLATLMELQRNLLSNGFRLLKVGGLLIYSTCSFTVAQNEDVIEWFLNNYSNAVLMKIEEAKNWPCKEGKIPKTIRFDPLVSNTSGLFIAKITKI